MTLQSLNPLTPIKKYIIKRREIREALTLLSLSGVVRPSVIEVRWGRRGPYKTGKEVRTVIRSRS